MIELGETYSSGLYEMRDSAGVLGAATVTVAVTLPDGTSASPTVANPATGQYTFDYLTTQVGSHSYVVSATGGVLGTLIRKIADTFAVGTAAAAGIVSMAEAKNHLNIPLTKTSWDEELELMIAAATEKIEDRCGPVLRRTVTNERHPGRATVVYLHETPVISVTSAVPIAGGSAISTAGLDVDPLSGRVAYLTGGAFPWGEHYWTYVAGRLLIPAGLRLAALNFVKGSWETQRGAAGLPWQGSGDEPVEQAGMGLVLWRLEQDLKPFRRIPGQA